MPENFKRREIGKGIYLSSVEAARSKQNLITVNFIVPLSKETASEYAVAAKVLSKCCKKFPAYSLLYGKLSSLYSAMLTGGVMAFGDLQIISFSVNYIDDKYALYNEKIGEEVLDILLNVLFEPLTENNGFSEAITELEKNALVQGIEADLKDKRTYASIRANEIIYRNEPAALPETGTAEGVKRVTAKSAYKAYQRLLARGRIEIICSGQGDTDNIKRKITGAFLKIKREDTVPCFTELSPLKEKTENVREETEIQQTKLILAFKTDDANFRAMDLMSNIFGCSPNNKLFVNVREKLGLCYSCYSSYNKNKGVIRVSCGVDKENVQKAKEEIFRQLDKMQNGEFSDEDIENAKLMVKNSLKAFNDSLNYMAVWYFIRIMDDDVISPNDEIELYDKISREDIVAAAKSLKTDTVYVLTSDDK